jgi:hypothetical protein
VLQSSNRIGDEGAAGLGHALRVSGSLQKLFLVRLAPVVFELPWHWYLQARCRTGTEYQTSAPFT